MGVNKLKPTGCTALAIFILYSLYTVAYGVPTGGASLVRVPRPIVPVPRVPVPRPPVVKAPLGRAPSRSLIRELQAVANFEHRLRQTVTIPVVSENVRSGSNFDLTSVVRPGPKTRSQTRVLPIINPGASSYGIAQAGASRHSDQQQNSHTASSQTGPRRLALTSRNRFGESTSNVVSNRNRFGAPIPSATIPLNRYGQPIVEEPETETAAANQAKSNSPHHNPAPAPEDNLPRTRFNEIDYGTLKTSVIDILKEMGFDSTRTKNQESYGVYSVKNVRTGAIYYGTKSDDFSKPCVIWIKEEGTDYYTTNRIGEEGEKYEFLGTIKYTDSQNPYGAVAAATANALYCSLKQHFGSIYNPESYKPSAVINYKFGTGLIWSLETLAQHLARDIKNGNNILTANPPPITNNKIHAAREVYSMKPLPVSKPIVQEVDELYNNILSGLREMTAQYSLGEAVVDDAGVTDGLNEEQVEELEYEMEYEMKSDVEDNENGNEEGDNSFHDRFVYKDGKHRYSTYTMWDGQNNKLYFGTHNSAANRPCQIWKPTELATMYTRTLEDGTVLNYEYIGKWVYATSSGDHFQAKAAAETDAMYRQLVSKVGSRFAQIFKESGNIMTKRQANIFTLEELGELLKQDIAEKKSIFSVRPPESPYIDYNKLEIERVFDKPKKKFQFSDKLDLALAVEEFKENAAGDADAAIEISKSHGITFDALKNELLREGVIKKGELKRRQGYTQDKLAEAVANIKIGAEYSAIGKLNQEIPRTTISRHVNNPETGTLHKTSFEDERNIANYLRRTAVEGRRTITDIATAYGVNRNVVNGLITKIKTTDENTLQEKYGNKEVIGAAVTFPTKVGIVPQQLSDEKKRDIVNYLRRTPPKERPTLADIGRAYGDLDYRTIGKLVKLVDNSDPKALELEYGPASVVGEVVTFPEKLSKVHFIASAETKKEIVNYIRRTPESDLPSYKQIGELYNAGYKTVSRIHKEIKSMSPEQLLENYGPV